jgi:sugar phosphate isomerase/epimerase
MIAALREAAAFAAQAGIRLVLENEAAFTPSVVEHARIVDQVGSPALGLLLDTGNYSAGWPSVLQAARRAVHVHAKFWRVGADGQEPDMDYPGLLAVLRQADYRGWITYEYEAPENPDALRRAYDYLRRVAAAA